MRTHVNDSRPTNLLHARLEDVHTTHMDHNKPEDADALNRMALEFPDNALKRVKNAKCRRHRA